MRARDIPDPGLRLAIFDALLRLGHLDHQSLWSRLESIRDPDVEFSFRYQREWLAEAFGRLSMVELDPAQLGRIEHLDFEPGNDIYMLIEEVLDIDPGEKTRYYRLQSLAGIEHLTHLQVLNLGGHSFDNLWLRLQPLHSHPTLQMIMLGGHNCSGARALEHVPELAKLDVGFGLVDDPEVLDRLAARGVEVEGRRQ